MRLSKDEIKRIEQELGVPVIPQKKLSEINISQINVELFLREKQKKPGMKIGFLKKDTRGLVVGHTAGIYVLFTPYTVQECYGNMLWEEMKQHTKLCTIETPNGSDTGITTSGCIVGVPLDRIEFELVPH